MKYLLAISILLLGCSKNAEVSSAPAKTEKVKVYLELPSDLEDLPSEELAQLTQKVVETEAEVSVGPIRKCLLHNRRPDSIPFCLAIWSAQSSYNSEIEQFILANLNQSRNHALAAILREYSLKSISFYLLREVLGLLKEDETWVKASLISRWIDDQRGIYLSFEEQDQLIQAAWPKPTDSPFDFSAAYSVIQKLRPGKIPDLLNSYCRANVEGVALHRCWRVVSAARQSSVEDKHLLTYLPAEKEPNWQLFLRNFPQF